MTESEGCTGLCVPVRWVSNEVQCGSGWQICEREERGAGSHALASPRALCADLARRGGHIGISLRGAPEYWR